jgi:hypothetical protein
VVHTTAQQIGRALGAGYGAPAAWRCAPTSRARARARGADASPRADSRVRVAATPQAPGSCKWSSCRSCLRC